MEGSLACSRGHKPRVVLTPHHIVKLLYDVGRIFLDMLLAVAIKAISFRRSSLCCH